MVTMSHRRRLPTSDSFTASTAPAPRGDFAYAALLGAIAAGTFKPGHRMREVAVCEWLGVSRTPVREALRRLEADGVLTHVPRVGMLVTPVDRAMVAELYAMREILEGAAARMCAENANRADLDGLHALLVREAKLPIDAAAAAAHNRTFHRALYEAAHNRYLLKSLRAIADSLLLLGPTTMSSPKRQRSAYEDHVQVIAAIAARDPDRAEARARDHIKAAYRERLRLLFGEGEER